MKQINHYAEQLRLGRISRREFLGRASALGLSVAAASSMASVARAQTPKQGGSLRMGIGAGSTTDTLDPGTSTDTYTQSFGFAMRNALTEVNSENELIPELATSWESSPDAKVWTFELRRGVEFHNGKTMDSDDVVASFQHHMTEDSNSAFKGVLVDQVAGINKDGANTVTFHLHGPNADFPFLMSDYHVLILPSEDGVVDWQSGNGTGGYVLDNYDPGVNITFSRNPNYWKEGRAHFDDVNMLAIKDVPARTNALRTGEIHVMDRPDTKTLDLLERGGGLSIIEAAGSQHYTYPMRCDVAPFSDNNVRLALKYAVDRQELLDKVLGGRGTLGNDQPIGKSYKYYADLPQREYDPDKVKFHLKKAGLDSLSVTMNISDAAFSGATDGASLYSEQAKKAGIDLKVVREPQDGYWANVWMQKAWTGSFWNPRPTVDQMFSVAYARDADWNEAFWDNDRFNKLLIQARGELNESKRGEMYREMQMLCKDDGGELIPFFANYIIAASEDLGHDTVSTSWDMDGTRLIERWWFV